MREPEMTFYQRQGTIPPKRYTTLRRENGGMYHEELVSTQGFVGASSVLYRLSAPTRILRIEESAVPQSKSYDGPAENMLFRPDVLIGSGDAYTSRVPLFHNSDFAFSLCRPDVASEGFYRNGDSDEVIFVVAGQGVFECALGTIEYRARDFVVVPRGTTYRWAPSQYPQDLVVIETGGPVGPPAKYRSACGQLIDSSPFHERDLRGPQLAAPIDETGEYGVVIKSGGRTARYVFDRHPFDVVGWDGYLYPYALNLSDFEALSSSIHPMPDQYQVFGSRGVAICALVPHANASHPDANPAQPHHMNLDYDELLYRFMPTDPLPALARTITLHPRGLAHGPKPGYENAPVTPYLDFWGLMVDCEQPVHVSMQALEARDESYASLWL
jgi:homogentisate 1,2-dioxygenase